MANPTLLLDNWASERPFVVGIATDMPHSLARSLALAQFPALEQIAAKKLQQANHCHRAKFRPHVFPPSLPSFSLFGPRIVVFRLAKRSFLLVH